MMECAKVILPKVCFWKSSFKKELGKCVNWTRIYEVYELCSWCYENFSEMHSDILDEVFVDAAFKIKNPGKSKTLYSGNSKEKQLKYRKVAYLLPIRTC